MEDTTVTESTQPTLTPKRKLLTLTTKVVAAKGSHLKDADAELVHATLLEIEKANGVATPQLLLTSATPITSPLHNHFDWNDTTAAQAHRITQAGQLIRAVRLTVLEAPQMQPTRAFVSVKGPEGYSYASTMKVMGEPELRRQMVERARAELKAWTARYAAVLELAELVAGIEKLEAVTSVGEG